MCREKAKTAKFVRVINKQGYDKMLSNIGEDLKEKLTIIHCGIKIESLEFYPQNKNVFRIVVPASYIEVKGHTYLIKALYLLSDLNFICDCYGSGELKDSLQKEIEKSGLQDKIRLNNILPHNELLRMYTLGLVS